MNEWFYIGLAIASIYLILGVLMGRFLAALTAPTQADYELTVLKIMFLWPLYLVKIL